MAHPQNTPRGLFSKWNILIPTGKGFSFNDYSASTPLITANSTGAKVAGTVTVSNQATYGKLSANSTALILPNSVRVGSLASYITANSTGIKIGTKYISTNSTGN